MMVDMTTYILIFALAGKKNNLLHTTMDIDIPNDIRAIHKIFKSKGKELFVVGGSIRDALLGKAPKDCYLIF